MLTFLWERFTDEGGAVSNTRQKAQLRMWSWHQTSTWANLQHNTLQSPSVRCVSELLKAQFVCILSVFLTISSCCCLITDENCRDRRHDCVKVVQARLCVYYKTACCASCTHSAQRAKRHWPANHKKPKRPRSTRSQGWGQTGLMGPEMASL